MLKIKTYKMRFVRLPFQCKMSPYCPRMAGTYVHYDQPLSPSPPYPAPYNCGGLRGAPTSKVISLPITANYTERKSSRTVPTPRHSPVASPPPTYHPMTLQRSYAPPPHTHTQSATHVYVRLSGGSSCVMLMSVESAG